MKHGEKMLLCMVAGLALCMAANAVTSDSSGTPYQGIVERNVFGLKAPPPPPDPEANKPPPPKILLQGITTILGNKRALFKVAMPPKAGEPAKGEQSFILVEGQRDGDIEVLEIDAVAGTVKVNNYGTITSLNFKDNGITPPAAPAPGALPNPAGFMPKPAGNVFTPPGGAQPIPTARPMRLPGLPGAAASSASAGATPVYASGAPAYPGSVPVNAGGLSLPGFGAASSAGSPASQAQQTTAALPSAEVQAVLLEAQRQRYRNEGNPLANLLPSTALSRELTPAASGNPAGTTTPKPSTQPGPPGFPPMPQ